MDANTFTLFSSLPPELRVMIWQAAVRPSGPDHAGIQQFAIYSNSSLEKMVKKPRLLLPHISQPRWYGHTRILSEEYVAGIPGQKNRSAYLWDAGLWTACVESRQVIMQTRMMRAWNDPFNEVKWHDAAARASILGNLEARLIYRDERPLILEQFRNLGTEFEEDYQEMPSSVMAPCLDDARGKEWQLMIKPFQDGLKVDPGDISKLLKGSYKDWSFINMEQVAYDMPFSNSLGHLGIMRNILLEFDPSWNLHWPKSFTRLHQERTPRGFAAGLMRKIYVHDFTCRVWLIDRKAVKPHEVSMAVNDTTAESEAMTEFLAAHRPKSFYDLEEEYEVFKSDEMPRLDSAAYFLFKLKEYSFRDLELLSEDELDWETDDTDEFVDLWSSDSDDPDDIEEDLLTLGLIPGGVQVNEDSDMWSSDDSGDMEEDVQNSGQNAGGAQFMEDANPVAVMTGVEAWDDVDMGELLDWINEESDDEIPAWVEENADAHFNPIVNIVDDFFAVLCCKSKI